MYCSFDTRRKVRIAITVSPSIITNVSRQRLRPAPKRRTPAAPLHQVLGDVLEQTAHLDTRRSTAHVCPLFARLSLSGVDSMDRKSPIPLENEWPGLKLSGVGAEVADGLGLSARNESRVCS